MKTMTCDQLAGACDQTFTANTFEEIAQMSKEHAMEMVSNGDQAHIDKMDEMKKLMDTPGAAEKWFAAVKEEFEKLPEN